MPFAWRSSSRFAAPSPDNSGGARRYFGAVRAGTPNILRTDPRAGKSRTPIARYCNAAAGTGSLLRLAEIFPQIFRIGWRLILLDRHEVAFAVREIQFAADRHPTIVLGAGIFLINRVELAPIEARYSPRPRQRMVEGGDLIAQHVRIGLVEINPLLDERLVVAVQRNAGRIERARPPHIAGLDFERVVGAVAIGVEPLADGIAGELRVEFLGPVASVSIDAPDRAHGFDQHICDVRLDHDFHRHIEGH